MQLPTLIVQQARAQGVPRGGGRAIAGRRGFLEEAGLPYELVPVDAMKGEQFQPSYLETNPNGKRPAIVDVDRADRTRPIDSSRWQAARCAQAA